MNQSRKISLWIFEDSTSISLGLLLAFIGIYLWIYNGFLQDEHRVCTVYADKHGGHVETYLKSIVNGTSYVGYRVEMPNGSHITADEIKRINAGRK